MKKSIFKVFVILLSFCIAFSGLPLISAGLNAQAATTKAKKIKLKVFVTGQTTAKLKWNKIKRPGKGYAVFRDGKVIARLNKSKHTFTDKGLAPGSTHRYQIKTYTKKKIKKWYNKKTKKWQKRRPAKKNRGKSKKVKIYIYSKKSNTVKIQTNIADYHTGFPAYWETYLTEKYTTLYMKDALIENNGDSFIFITDVHYDNNVLRSPALIHDIVKNTAVNIVFNGGDILDAGDTVAVAKEKLIKWQSMMNGLRTFNIVGNHDNNNYNGNNPGNALTKEQYYNIMIKPMEQWINTDGKLYFCVDNESQKIRYICLAIEAFTNVEPWNIQRTWLQSKLTEKDSSWTIVVFQHRIWGSSTDSISPSAQKTIDAINEVYSKINAKFIGIIAGHTHLDYYSTEPNKGYLLIACNCDTLNGTSSGYTRTAGTTSEQSFDVFHIDKTNNKLYSTRIGAGNDREWRY